MRRINRVQRLARREEKDTVKRIFLLSVVSIFLIIILLTVGVTALGKFADLLGVVFKEEEQGANDNTVAAPILDPLPSSTNQDKIRVSGFSAGGQKVAIYLNGEKSGETIIQAGRFSHELSLNEGNNEIYAKALVDDTEGEGSDTQSVNLDKTPPKLEVSTPVEGQNFLGNNRVPVEGTTEQDSQVFVNGFLANVANDGKFDVDVPIVEGESDLEVKALDEAGNTSVVKIKVNFRK